MSLEETISKILAKTEFVKGYPTLGRVLLRIPEYVFFGGFMPTQTQEKYAKKIRITPTAMTDYSLTVGYFINASKIILKYSAFSIAGMYFGDTLHENGTIDTISKSIDWWIIIASADLLLRTSYRFTMKRPIPSVFVEIPSRLGFQYFKSKKLKQLEYSLTEDQKPSVTDHPG